MPGIFGQIHQLLQDRHACRRRKEQRDGRLAKQTGNKQLIGIPAWSAFEGGKFLIGVVGKLLFEPVVNLGAREPPFAGNLLSGKMAAIGQLVQFACIALQIAGQLTQVHRLLIHECSFGTRPRHLL